MSDNPDPNPATGRLAKAAAWFNSLPKRRQFGLQLSGGLILFLAVMAGSAEYTSRPTFCPTCHYMEPYYESWIAAPAHADVSCVKCHFPPGVAGTVRGKMEGLVQVVNYLASSYTRRKPWAEIEDQSCLQSGCHDTRLLEGTVGFKGVAFDHAPHLTEMRRGKQLRCTSCHSQIVQGDHITVTETSCFLCHFKQDAEMPLSEFAALSDCQTCHRWDSVTVEQPSQITEFHESVMDRGLSCDQCHSRTIVGDGFVPHDNCFSCHSEPDRLNKIDSTTFLHEAHISKNKIECTQCHLRVQHKIQRVLADQELECATCHRSTHREQVMLFTGHMGNGDPDQPSPMFEAGLDCAGCHVFHDDLVAGENNTRVATSQSCETCHGTGYNRLLTLWKESANKSLVNFDRAINQVERAARSAGTPAVAKAKPYLDSARKLHHVVVAGKPVHNVAFYDRLIQSGYSKLIAAVQDAQLQVQLPEYHARTEVPGRCANCHAGIESFTSDFQGKPFSHELHFAEQGVDCGTCHSNAVRHGKLVMTPQACNDCHHKAPPKEVTCESCHELEASIYAGTYRNLDTPDYMFEEDVECVDCHIPDDKVIRPRVSVCLDCHDEGYDSDAEDWKKEIAELSSSVRSALAAMPVSAHETAEYQRALSILGDVETGSAGGIHNYELTSELLSDVRKSLESGRTDRPAQAQAVPPPPTPKVEEDTPAEEEPAEAPPPEREEATRPQILHVAETMPQLIGGLEGLQQRLEYPVLAERRGVEGRVVVQFVVDEQGRVIDPVVLQGIGSGCDEEAIRAVQESRFDPGMQGTTPVKVKMSLPITFRLR